MRDAEEGCPATFFHLTLSASGADKTDCKYWIRAEFADDLELWRKHCSHRDEWLQSSSRGYPDRPANVSVAMLAGCDC